MKQMNRILTRTLGVAVAIAGLAVALPAYASIEYTVGGWGGAIFPGTAADDPAAAPPNVPAGNYPSGPYWGPNGYPGDTVQIQGSSGSIDASGTIKIGTLSWTVGYTYAGNGNPSDPNEGWKQLLFTVDASRAITIGGQTVTLSQPGSLECNWDADYFTLSSGPSVSLIVQGYEVMVTPLGSSRTWLGDKVGDHGSLDVMAQFDIAPVPEPTTMIAGALLLLPFGASTLRMLRRRQTA